MKVGDNAYVGSGSVITENVPSGALALGRGRQVNKTDWKPGAAKTPAATAKPNATKSAAKAKPAKSAAKPKKKTKR